VAHKIHPVAFRLGVSRSWDTLGWSGTHSPQLVKAQLEVRHYLEQVWRAAQCGPGRSVLHFAPGQLRLWSALHLESSPSGGRGRTPRPAVPSTVPQVGAPRPHPTRWTLEGILHDRSLVSATWSSRWLQRRLHPEGRPGGRPWPSGHTAQSGPRGGANLGPGAASLTQVERTLTRALGGSAQVQVWRGASPAQSAQWVCEQVVRALEQQRSWRWIQRQLLRPLADSPQVQGIRCRCSGRLQGAELARREVWRWGRTPLQSLHAALDYAAGTAYTAQGTLGVKVWLGYAPRSPEMGESPRSPGREQAHRSPLAVSPVARARGEEHRVDA